MSEALTEDDVRRIAELARLDLPDVAPPPLARDLSAVLGYMDTLDELDLEDVPVFSLDQPTPLRPDDVHEGLSPGDALGQAPQRDGTSFVVPKVIG